MTTHRHSHLPFTLRARGIDRGGPRGPADRRPAWSADPGLTAGLLASQLGLVRARPRSAPVRPLRRRLDHVALGASAVLRATLLDFVGYSQAGTGGSAFGWTSPHDGSVRDGLVTLWSPDDDGSRVGKQKPGPQDRRPRA
jgi:hypothetical protein